MIEIAHIEEERRRSTVDRQFEHASWHGETPHHWHVGVTALDGLGANILTESVTSLYGLPVYRVIYLTRESIVLVTSQHSSCHWPEGIANV